MELYVLAAGFLFVVVVGLILRFFNWIGRRRRMKRAARLEAAAKANRPAEIAVAPSKASIQHQQTGSGQHVPPAAPNKQAAAPPPPVAPQPAPAKSSEIIAAVATAISKPNAAATLAPGASMKSPPPPPQKFSSDRLPLPTGVEAPRIATTMTPQGATWTPPPLAIRAGEAANPPPPAPAAPSPPSAPLGPLVLSKPSVAATSAAAAPTTAAPEAPHASTPPQPAVAEPPAPRASDGAPKPSAAATLAPGATLKPSPKRPAAISGERLPLPAGVEPPSVSTTVQPAGATWTPPPQVIRDAEAPSPPPTPPKPTAPQHLGPLVHAKPSVGGTLASNQRMSPQMAAEAPDAPNQQSAHPLSAAPANASPAFKIKSPRPAPTPRPGPPPWAIVALKTSLPFRVRRPDTRLIGKTAKEVVLISRAREARRVGGRATRLRLGTLQRLH